MLAGSRSSKSRAVSEDRDFSFTRVPASARKGFLPMFFVMLGFTFFSASMSVGARLGIGFELKDFILSIAAGGSILAVYTGVLGYIGCKTGLGFDHLARHAFGRYGSFLPSLMIMLTQFGWFGVGVAMFAVPSSEVIGCSKWILILAAGICMTSSAYFGIKGMEIVSYISVPLILILGLYSVADASLSEGLVSLFGKDVETITLFQGIGLVVGSFISGGTTTPNFSRFCNRTKSAVIATVVAFLIGNSIMFIFGAVGGILTGKDDIFYVMIAQGLTTHALIVLGANVWTTNDNALYSGALGLSNITKIPKRPLVLIGGAAGTLLSLWLYSNFVDWLNILNASLPPVGAVIIADYFLHREDYSEDESTVRNVNPSSVAGVAAGSLTGIIVPWGIASVNAMAVAVLVYLAGSFLFLKVKVAR